MSKPVLEVCVSDLDSVHAAVAGGATRLELCSALSEGGVTPSIGLLRESRNICGDIKIHVLIRPRGGDFVYSPAEVACMECDVESAVANGADGIVIGALLPDGSIDMVTCRRLIALAGGRNVTFHRAFDVCRNSEEALADIIRLGCSRILTSGRHANAVDGIPVLRRLVERSGNRITILAGGGVGPDNAARIMRETGCRELHASARSTIESKMIYRNTAVSMGAPGTDEYMRKVSDTDIVRRIISEMNR